jgi:hypothetical protein
MTRDFIHVESGTGYAVLLVRTTKEAVMTLFHLHHHSAPEYFPATRIDWQQYFHHLRPIFWAVFSLALVSAIVLLLLRFYQILNQEVVNTIAMYGATGIASLAMASGYAFWGMTILIAVAMLVVVPVAVLLRNLLKN